jgi:hypothetical protein
MKKSWYVSPLVTFGPVFMMIGASWTRWDPDGVRSSACMFGGAVMLSWGLALMLQRMHQLEAEAP